MKYTVVWQTENSRNQDWIDEVFGPFIAEHVYDGKRELVLDHSILVEDFVYAKPIDYYTRFRGKDAFLATFQDEFFEFGLDVYRNFRGVFRAHWADVFNEKYLMKLPIGYTLGTRISDKSILLPTTKRRYLWSFLGQTNKASRPDMARELSRLEPHFFYPTDAVGGFAVYNRTSTGPRRFTRDEYGGFLQNSIFAPAPMGNVQVECYRPYEALESGAIPIVEKRMTLDYYRMLLGDHPMPTVRSWAEARRLMTDLLKTPERLDELQSECLEWWSDYKKSYTQSVGEFLARRAIDSDPLGELVTPWGQTRLWRYLELLRHHDLPATYRRVTTMVNRVLKTGKIRVAYTSKNRPVK